MNDLFRVILSLSLSGTLLFFLVLFAGKLLKERLGRTWNYYILLLVIFRFLLPITIDHSAMETFFLSVPAFHSD